jgi:hypothetical protein
MERDMSRGVPVRKVNDQVGKRASSFEVEIETFWCSRLCRLPPGKRVEVYLTPGWFLTITRKPDYARVGTYTKACELAWFREDCFEALESR